MIFGNLGGLKLPDICLTGEEKPRKYLIQETCPDRGSNLGPLRGGRACYRLAHSGGLEEYNVYSSTLGNFLHSPVISSLLAPNSFLNTLFPNALSLCSSLKVRDQVSQQYNITAKTLVLYVTLAIPQYQQGGFCANLCSFLNIKICKRYFKNIKIRHCYL